MIPHADEKVTVELDLQLAAYLRVSSIFMLATMIDVAANPIMMIGYDPNQQWIIKDAILTAFNGEEVTREAVIKLSERIDEMMKAFNKEHMIEYARAVQARMSERANEILKASPGVDERAKLIHEMNKAVHGVDMRKPKPEVH